MQSKASSKKTKKGDRIDKILKLLEKNEKRWKGNDARWEANEKRWEAADRKFERIILKLLEHDQRFDQMVTKVEFESFKNQILNNQDKVFGMLDDLQVEMASTHSWISRIEEKVDRHEKILNAKN